MLCRWMGGWTLQQLYAMPAEFYPVLVEMVTQQPEDTLD